MTFYRKVIHPLYHGPSTETGVAWAVYHVTARGNAREPIFADDRDRQRFVALLANEIDQQRWLCYAWCLMDNHYHLLFETPEPNLVTGMRRLNQIYTQSYNRCHGRVGHVLQGRYKSINLNAIPKEQACPDRPTPEKVFSAIADAFELSSDGMPERSHQPAFKAAVYLLRRVCNLSLREVARLAGVSPSRISPIQADLEQDEQVEIIDRLIRLCNIKH